MTKLGEKIVIAVSLTCLCIFFGIIWFANKWVEDELPIEDVASIDTAQEEPEESEFREAGFVTEGAREGELSVTLGKHCKKDDIYSQDDLEKKEIILYLPGMSQDEVVKDSVVADTNAVAGIKTMQQGDVLKLEIQMKNVCEYSFKTEGNQLKVKTENVSQKYSEIIVISGFTEEEQTALTKMDTAKVFYSDDVAFANEVRADAFLIFDQDLYEKQQEIIMYNDEYFLPDYDSRDLSRSMEQAYQKNGITDVTTVYVEDQLLEEAMVPAIRISGFSLENAEVVRELMEELKKDMTNSEEE